MRGLAVAKLSFFCQQWHQSLIMGPTLWGISKALRDTAEISVEAGMHSNETCHLSDSILNRMHVHTPAKAEGLRWGLREAVPGGTSSGLRLDLESQT